MRIGFVISSLQRGGAERVATLLANAWAVQGHAVSLVTFEVAGTQPAYHLNESVDLRSLGIAAASGSILGGIANNLERIWSLRQCLQYFDPDVVVSFLTETNVLAITAGLGAKWPTIVSERIHPAHHPVSRSWGLLRKISYPKAAAVVVQGADIARWIHSQTGTYAVTVPNPIDVSEFFPRVSPITTSGRRKQLLAVGRLSHQKGYDILIRGFSAAAPSIPDWDLSIFGEGPHEPVLRAMIDDLQLGSRISINKSVPNIADIYRAADAFVHPARYEGYPNVIVEALASGLPVIASNSQDVVRELLENGQRGILYEAESPESLAQALIETLRDQARCESLAKAAPDAVRANDVTAISARWILLFQEAIQRRAASPN